METPLSFFDPLKWPAALPEEFVSWYRGLERHREFSKLHGRLAALSAKSQNPSAFEFNLFWNLWRTSRWVEDCRARRPSEGWNLELQQYGPFTWRSERDGSCLSVIEKRFSPIAIFGTYLAMMSDTLGATRRDWTLAAQLLSLANIVESPDTVRMASGQLLSAWKTGNLRYVGWPADMGSMDGLGRYFTAMSGALK